LGLLGKRLPLVLYFITKLTNTGKSKGKVRAVKINGPHNYDILCNLIGSLLGESYVEKHGNGTRIFFQQNILTMLNYYGSII